MKSCRHCDRLVGYPGTSWTPLLCPSCGEPVRELEPPESAPDLPGLKLIASIGRGGMGRVYLAREVDIDRIVAVKVRLRRDRDEERLARFRREAEMAGRLRHSNILQVYDFRIVGDAVFYTMPYVAGPSLAQAVRWARAFRDPSELWCELLQPSSIHDDSDDSSISVTSVNPVQKAIHLACRRFADLARGLHAVHGAGILHRDVKPGNVLVSPAGQLLLMDFGLVRAEDGSALTVPGQLLGTPYCMSPEQIDAGGRPLDHRSDIYSLGVTLYMVLTLERPYRAEGVAETLQMVTSRMPRRPREVSPQIPREMDAILMHCMAKDPDDRYPSARALAQDLNRFVHFEPVVASPPRWTTGVTLFMRRHRHAMGVTALVLGLVFALLGALFLQGRRQDLSSQRRAHLAMREARGLIEKARSAFGWAVGFEEREHLLEARVWSEKGTALLQRAEQQARQAVQLSSGSDASRRMVGEIEVRELLHASAMARRRGEYREAEQILDEAEEVATAHPRLQGLCRQARKESRLKFIAAPRIAAATLSRPAEGRRGERRDVVRLVPDFNPLPAEGSWVLEVTDDRGRTLQAPVWIGPPGLENQKIDVPLTPTEIETRYPGMILVPGGFALLGDDLLPQRNGQHGQRTVCVEAFLISECEVTNGDYARFLSDRSAFEKQMDEVREEFDAFKATASRTPLIPLGWEVLPRREVLDLPVTGISVIEAMAFARWRGARLPSEDEWEKAARGVEGQRFVWGESFRGTELVRYVGLRAVGSRPGDTSPYGVMDMGANAAEFTSTMFQTSPDRSADRKVVTKGWFTQEAASCAAASRRMSSGGAAARLGFRLAQALEASGGRD